MSDRIVYVKSAHSKVHLGVMRGAVLYTPESCNADDLDPETRVEIDSLEDVPTVDRCQRCFPVVAIQGQAPSETVA
jgi:hypothetical protein